MARFGRKFEIKDEMKDIKEIRPYDKQKAGGQSTLESQEDIKREANNIGFDDVNLGLEDNEESLEEFRTANAQVESELAQYYYDDITIEELKAYLVSKISDIYGEKLAQCNILVDSVVEGFLDINEFNGVESYRQLTQTIEESIITISKMQTNKNKVKTTEEEPKGTSIETLSEEEKQKIVSTYKNMSIQGELSANAYISSQAKKFGVDKKELTKFVLEKGKSEIKSPDKVLHYHRTSIQSFKQIMQTGFLLNRKNMQLNGIDISGLKGSSSPNIQFSRDIYDTNGELQSSGFDINNNLGANSADVVFVMSPELMNEDTYNCFGTYPTVEKADIQRCCATILAKDHNIQMQIESILKGKGLSTRTMLQEEFDREAVLHGLDRTDLSKQIGETGIILHSVNGKPIREEETGTILKSVNGSDILSSGVEATEVIRAGKIKDEIQKIRSIQISKVQSREQEQNRQLNRE